MTVGLHVHKLVVVARGLGNENVIILHPPMVVRIVKERQFSSVAVTEKLVLVRKQKSCQHTFITVSTVDSGWGSWTNWSSCSATCGGGQKTRLRFCIPSKGISDCDGFMEHKVVCNSISCPGETLCAAWNNAYKRSQACLLAA